MRFYLAGGAVRDLLLGRPLSDRDYLVTDCDRSEFARAFPAAREVGHAFPIFWLDRTEFAFPRSDSLVEEVRSRDLTVNALLLDDDGELYCHPQGLADLHDRILRPASPRSMLIDPLRVFRAARFHAQLPDFILHDELVAAMAEIPATGLLTGLSPDRVGNEVRKALRAPRPGNFLRLLARTGCLVPWFAELDGADEIPAGPPAHHDTDVLEHICRIMDRLAGDETGAWMGLCHDLGKTLTDKDRLPSHHGHDRAGMRPAGELADRLRLPTVLRTAGMKAAQWHMIAARYGELRPGTKVDLLMDAHLSRILSPLFRLARADHGTDDEARAATDLRTILKIRLRPEERNLGKESGDRLRQLRALALSRSCPK
ncbi:MAG: tRNA nucleotidyltransferase [Desulfovibrionaceae bacterium]|nr:tRNA nucleotidyltransferase [Desulfovibrionaceae bacterium]